jgi:predicted Zn-dependent protease
VIARALTKETGLSIKSTLWSPSDVENPFPGTDQYPAENYFSIGARMARTLPDASARTYFIVLTNRDINPKTGNFRFQFSMHHPAANTSVLSFARLQHNMDGSSSPADVVAARIGKMLLRIVGEMRLGWKRTNDPSDLMYAPIMSVEDVDRMNLVHTFKRRGTVSPAI